MRSLVKHPFLAVCLALALLSVGAVTVTFGPTATGQAASGEVVILSTSVSGGLSSREANAIVAAGKTPVLKTPTEWSSMTAADFAGYDGIVLGDPYCSTDAGASIGAAEANALTWGPVINGNVIIIGSDPVLHGTVGAVKLIDQGMAFALAESGKIGAYIDLSCYYHMLPSGTAVPALDGLDGGDFTVIGATNLPGLDDVHIVASHPALAGLTDADLSNWHSSVHEGFETWPVPFEALAIARDPAGSYQAPDGTVGYPYILARGVSVISDISLAPESATNPIGTSHTLTATVTSDDPVPGSPAVEVDVTFEVIAGPHNGVSGAATTNGSGQAIFSYEGTSIGVDTIQATFVDEAGLTQRSNRVTKEWVETGLTPTPIRHRTRTPTPEPTGTPAPPTATPITPIDLHPPASATASGGAGPAISPPATGDGPDRGALPVGALVAGALAVVALSGIFYMRTSRGRR